MQAVPWPKLVIAVGACGFPAGRTSTTPRSTTARRRLLPVDLFVPGCPPHPLSILDGLLSLLGHRLSSRGVLGCNKCSLRGFQAAYQLETQARALAWRRVGMWTDRDFLSDLSRAPFAPRPVVVYNGGNSIPGQLP